MSQHRPEAACAHDETRAFSDRLTRVENNMEHMQRWRDQTGDAMNKLSEEIAALRAVIAELNLALAKEKCPAPGLCLKLQNDFRLNLAACEAVRSRLDPLETQVAALNNWKLKAAGIGVFILFLLSFGKSLVDGGKALLQ
jgi:septal ring factor EnvC (AmiA/AmiB activator)